MEKSTKKKWKKYIALIGILFLFPLTWVLVFSKFGHHHFQTLPYYDPATGVTSEQPGYAIPDFVFTNQEGQTFSKDSLKGSVWIAAFFNLHDEHVSKITERLLNVNFQFRNEPDVKIVCFSTDCDHDDLKMIKDYVDQNTRYNAFPGKWEYLTGNQQAMQSYFRNGFLIQDLSKEAIFRLIDPDGHVRGMYGNTEYHIRDAMEDLALLKKEIDLKKYREKKSQENR